MQVSARQSQRDELIRSQTNSTTTKVTHCHSPNIVIQSDVNRDSTFIAGATKDHLSQWTILTSDKFILTSVAGSSIEFDHLPTQCSLPQPLTFSASEAGIVDEQIRNFLDLRIVEKTIHSCPEFVSNVFIQAKKKGSRRLLLNLVHLHPCVSSFQNGHN